VKYGGGECVTAFGSERGRVDLPVKASVGHFVRADGCARTPKAETLSGGKVLRETWGSGREGAEVVLYTLREGGHGWPGSAQPGPGAGPATPYLSATGALWRFFERHPKVVGGAAPGP
jgi:polyhydroxybutyrate depolymerase